MSDDLRALPRDTPDYHSRQAAHLRALAESTTTARLKARLLKDAEQHEEFAGLAEEEAIGACRLKPAGGLSARAAAVHRSRARALAPLAAECPSWIGRQLRAHTAERRGCSRLPVGGAIKRK